MTELLAPVGNWSMLTAAVKAGADAVYFGIQGMNMRASANNFSLEELNEVTKYCHKHNVKTYCTVNIIIFENELNKLNELLTQLKLAEIDAVICWDLAVIKKCQELGIETHLSTQASVSNSDAANYWKKLGVSRIVLARECSLEDVKTIKKKTNLEIETFIHGARCISLSGRCFMSQELYKKSANRGECLQPCRREFKVTGDDNKVMILNHNFIMSAKDLCALPLLPEIIPHVSCLKIEGRNRGAEYVFKVVSVYKEAIEAIKDNKFTDQFIKQAEDRLKEVYNKGFSQGYYVDYPHHQKADLYGSKSTLQKIQLGKVTNFFKNKSVAEFKLESAGLKIGDKIAFIGNKTGYHEEVVTEIHDSNGKIESAEKGILVSVKSTLPVRDNDKVFLLQRRVNK